MPMIARFIDPVVKLGSVIGVIGLMCACFGGNARAEGFDFKSSELSNERYAVDTIWASEVVVGCAVGSKIFRPPLFVTLLITGGGSVSIVGPAFKVRRTDEATVQLDLRIGQNGLRTFGLVDGNLITISLTSDELQSAVKDGVQVNGIMLDPKEFVIEKDLASKCIAGLKR